MGLMAQNRLLERETSKMYKAKIKEYKKTGWKLAGSSKTLEVALLEHYEKMKDPQKVELVAPTMVLLSGILTIACSSSYG